MPLTNLEMIACAIGGWLVGLVVFVLVARRVTTRGAD